MGGGGGNSGRSKNITLLEFPEGWEGVRKIEKTPFVGVVWIFSGTTQYVSQLVK